MLLSMTGFSALTTQIPHKYGNPLHITLTLKSLNGRFFEISCRLPHAFNQIELSCTRLLKEKLVRGSVYCTINVSNAQNLTLSIAPATAVIQGYIKAIRAIQKDFDIDSTLAIKDLLLLPDIFERTETSLDDETNKAILKLVDNAADQLILTRQAEGKLLEQDLSNRLATITHLMQDIEPRSKHVAETRKTKLLANIKSLTSTSSPENADQSLPFVYSQLEKLDIHEEIVRLNAHLHAFKECMESSALEKGKRLDFITQELMREITTLTAKAGDAQLGNLGIDLKVELEKIREQVQNIL